MKLDARVTVDVPRPPQQVFDYAVANENLIALLRPFGPIPGVARVELPAGGALAAGVLRQVFMTDGTKVLEQVIALDPPASGRPGRHEYRWTHAPAPPFSLLVRGAHSVWTFTAERAGTRVDWTYTFELTSPLAYPLAALTVALFRRWMHKALGRLRDGG